VIEALTAGVWALAVALIAGAVFVAAKVAGYVIRSVDDYFEDH